MRTNHIDRQLVPGQVLDVFVRLIDHLAQWSNCSTVFDLLLVDVHLHGSVKVRIAGSVGADDLRDGRAPDNLKTVFLVTILGF